MTVDHNWLRRTYFKIGRDQYRKRFICLLCWKWNIIRMRPRLFRKCMPFMKGADVL